jgi:retinaldehyde-binding protein 1
MHLLPLTTRDPFGRPILVLKASDLTALVQQERDYRLRDILPVVFERLRLLLTELNASVREEEGVSDGPLSSPILQYSILIDVKDISFQNLVRIASARICDPS